MKFSNNSSPYKWVVLGVFALVLTTNAMICLSFAPLISFIEHEYGVSEFLAGTLVMVFPLFSIIISFPCGMLIDRLGYKFSIRTGCILIAVFAYVRIIDAGFWVLFAGQLGIAIGVPFTINATAKVIGDWFRNKQIAFANGIASCGLFTGMALGLGLAPILVGAVGFRKLMMLQAGIAIVVVIIVTMLIKERSKAVNVIDSSWTGFSTLIKNPNLRILFILSFVATGYFNGLTTWLEPMLAEKGLISKEAGLIGASLIVGGIIGSLIMPALSDKLGKRKPFILICCFAGALSTYPLCTGTDFKILLIIGISVGGFFFPGYPLMISLLKEIAGTKRTGIAMALFTLAGNIGGTFFIISMQIIKNASNTWLYSIYMLIIMLSIAFLTTTRLKEPQIA